MKLCLMGELHWKQPLAQRVINWDKALTRSPPQFNKQWRFPKLFLAWENQPYWIASKGIFGLQKSYFFAADFDKERGGVKGKIAKDRFWNIPEKIRDQSCELWTYVIIQKSSNYQKVAMIIILTCSHVLVEWSVIVFPAFSNSAN